MPNEPPARATEVATSITVEDAQARGLHLVCTDPAKGIILSVGDIITHTASGVDLEIVEVVNERQALARKMGRTRRRSTRAIAPSALASRKVLH